MHTPQRSDTLVGRQVHSQRSSKSSPAGGSPPPASLPSRGTPSYVLWSLGLQGQRQSYCHPFASTGAREAGSSLPSNQCSLIYRTLVTTPYSHPPPGNSRGSGRGSGPLGLAMLLACTALCTLLLACRALGHRPLCREDTEVHAVLGLPPWSPQKSPSKPPTSQPVPPGTSTTPFLSISLPLLPGPSSSPSAAPIGIGAFSGVPYPALGQTPPCPPKCS